MKNQHPEIVKTMKKQYPAPSTRALPLRPSRLMLVSGVYTDDPQNTSSALSREHGAWDDEEE